MAVYHGKSGMVDFNSADIFHVQNWSLTTTVEMAEITKMGDAWGNHEYGLTDFTATAVGLNSDALDTPALLGGNAVLTLELADGGTDKIVGTVILNGIEETLDIEGVGTITYSFEGDDADGLSYTIS